MTSHSDFPVPFDIGAMERLPGTYRLWTPRDEYTEWHAGDSLLVNESYALRTNVDVRKQPEKARHYALYRVDNPEANTDPMNWHAWGPWQPAKTMPAALVRWRLELEHCEARQLLDVTEDDALLAGYTPQRSKPRRRRSLGQPALTAREAFLEDWDRRHTTRLGCWSWVEPRFAAKNNPRALVWHLKLYPYSPFPEPAESTATA